MRYKRQRRRKITRMPWFDYSRVGVYYITICTADRVQRFGEVINGVMRLNDAGRIVDSAWRDLPRHYPHIELDEFVVVPEHVHGLIAVRPNPDLLSGVVGAIHELPLQPPRDISDQKTRRRMPLPLVVGRLKMVSAKRINEIHGTAGRRVWQRGYDEAVVRNERDLERIRRYIINNPKRWRPRR